MLVNASLLLGGAAAQLQAPAHAQRMERPDALRLVGDDVSRLVLERGDTAAKHYPAEARRQGVDGVVLVDLFLNVQGQVLEAQVIAETPPGHGFGIAALDTAKTFEFTNPFKRQVLLAWELEFLP